MRNFGDFSRGLLRDNAHVSDVCLPRYYMPQAYEILRNRILRYSIFFRSPAPIRDTCHVFLDKTRILRITLDRFYVHNLPWKNGTSKHSPQFNNSIVRNCYSLWDGSPPHLPLPASPLGKIGDKSFKL